MEKEPEVILPETQAQLERMQKDYALKILLRLYAGLGHTARLAVGREMHDLINKKGDYQ